jgi:hypothetical protein
MVSEEDVNFILQLYLDGIELIYEAGEYPVMVKFTEKKADSINVDMLNRAKKVSRTKYFFVMNNLEAFRIKFHRPTEN